MDDENIVNSLSTDELMILAETLDDCIEYEAILNEQEREKYNHGK